MTPKRFCDLRDANSGHLRRYHQSCDPKSSHVALRVPGHSRRDSGTSFDDAVSHASPHPSPGRHRFTPEQHAVDWDGNPPFLMRGLSETSFISLPESCVSVATSSGMWRQVDQSVEHEFPQRTFFRKMISNVIASKFVKFCSKSQNFAKIRFAFLTGMTPYAPAPGLWPTLYPTSLTRRVMTCIADR